MRFRIPPALALVAPLLVTACGGAPPDAPEGRESAETPSSPLSVELVGPGTVSSELPEFAAALSPSGDTLWFNRTSADRSRIELYWAFREGDGWRDAGRFPPTEGWAAWDPFLTPDGRHLWITVDGPRPDGSDGDLDLWRMERTEEGWSEPRFVPPPLNSDSTEVFNSLTRDGLLVFSSYRGDGVRRIWAARPDGEGGWSEPEPLDLGVGPEASNPAVAPDGSFLVLSLREGDAAPDLVVWCRSGEGWIRGAPLPEPINGPWADFAPAVTERHLWFTSERPGVVGEQPDSVRPPGDLYRVDLAPVRAACAGA